MSYLIDTDIVIDGIKGREPAASFISDQVEVGVYISLVTYGEVLEGLLYPMRGTDDQRNRFYTFVDLFDLLGIGLGEARRYAQIRSELRSRGTLIPDNDLWIATTALVRNLTLVTRDQHYTWIPDLHLYVP